MIKRLLGLVFNRWVLLAVVLIAIALVLWIVGPLVAIGDKRPLDSETARWIAIGVVAGLTAAFIAWQRLSARRGNTAVVNQLLAAGPPGAVGAGRPRSGRRNRPAPPQARRVRPRDPTRD